MKALMFLLVWANLCGVALGMLVYYPQLMAANPLFWVFIPDCPLYILLATLFYLGVLRGGVLRAITAIGLMKYGIWTIFVLFYYSGSYLGGWFGWLLVVEHIGMTLQYLLFAGAFGRRELGIALGWFLLNDAVDYLLGHHPALPSDDLGIIPAFAVALSLILPAFAYFAGERIGKNRRVEALRGMLGFKA